MITRPRNLILSPSALVPIELLQRKALSAATSVTFSGLNGNFDERYLIEFRVDITAAADKFLLLRPNNDTGGNYKCLDQEMVESGTSPSTQTQSRDAKNALVLGHNGWSHNGWLWTMGELDAKAGKNRLFWARAMMLDTTDTTRMMHILYGGVWKNTADNITSLVIDFESASLTGDARIYRAKRPF